jgi:N-acetylglucosaminyl-diphospho-decaprenol L-rhamnosyltransferase
MVSNNIKLSVIIVTYNSCNVIKECLESISLFNDIDSRLEIIIVDNSPQNKIQRVIQDLNLLLNLKYIHNPKNGGFGQGNNIGASHASGKYLLFLNPDTIIIEHIFLFALEQFNNDKMLGVFGMLLYDKNDKRCVNSFGYMPEKKKLLPVMFWWPFIKYINYSPKNIFPLGANLFVTRYLFENAGCFDENFFMCYEEPDLISRIPSTYKVKIFNKKIIHLDGHTTEEIGIENRLKQSFKSEKYYFDKNKFDYKKYSRRILMLMRIKYILYTLFGKDKKNLSIYIENRKRYSDKL